MRSFIAIKLSDEIKENINKFVYRLKETNADVKWIETDNLHLTLKFLGEIEDKLIEEIKKEVENVIRNFSKFEISLQNTGKFPERGKARVIWIGIKKGDKNITDLISNTENSLVRFGFKKESRNLTPHITIGRVKSHKNLEKLEKILYDSIDTKFGEMLVENIIFMKSELSAKGPKYTEILKWLFKPR